MARARRQVESKELLEKAQNSGCGYKVTVPGHTGQRSELGRQHYLIEFIGRRQEVKEGRAFKGKNTSLKSQGTLMKLSW